MSTHKRHPKYQPLEVVPPDGAFQSDTVFATYKTPKEILTYGWDERIAAMLEWDRRAGQFQIETREFNWYLGHAVTTVGSATDLKHFLPRALRHLLAAYRQPHSHDSDLSNASVLFSKLQYAELASWPAKQRDALRDDFQTIHEGLIIAGRELDSWPIHPVSYMLSDYWMHWPPAAEVDPLGLTAACHDYLQTLGTDRTWTLYATAILANDYSGDRSRSLPNHRAILAHLRPLVEQFELHRTCQPSLEDEPTNFASLNFRITYAPTFTPIPGLPFSQQDVNLVKANGTDSTDTRDFILQVLYDDAYKDLPIAKMLRDELDL